MSLTQESVLAPLPTTTRGIPTVISSDAKGERVAYASGKSIFIRSIDDPSKSIQYTGHVAATTVARISPSGFYCASGDVSGQVRVWECAPNRDPKEPIRTKGEYQIINGRINDIAWDGDSQRIIAVGDGKQRYGHCITADSGNSVGEISGHSSQINSVAIRQSRPIRAATAGDDRNVVFYQGVPFKFNSIPGQGKHNNYVYAIAYSPDGSLFASAGADKKICLYDGKTGEFQGEIQDPSEGHKGSIFGLAWSKDNKRIATASGDRTVKTWDTETGKVVHTWNFADTPQVTDQQVGVCWPAGRSDDLVISISLSGTLNHLLPASDRPSKQIFGHQKAITAFTVSNLETDPQLWTGDFEGRICGWSASKDGKTAATATSGPGHTNLISGMASHNSGLTDNATLYSISWDDTLRTTAAGTHQTNANPTKLASQPKAICSTKDGLAVIAQEKSVLVYADGQEDGELPLTCSPTALAAHASTVAVGGSDSSLRLFTVVPGKAPRQTAIVDKVSASAITSISFSESGDLVAAGTQTGKISVYKISTGLTGLVMGSQTLELVTDRWSAHSAKISGIAFNQESTHAVSGSLDTNLYLWSLAKPGNRVNVIGAHKEGVSGVVWLKNGVWTTGADASVKKWRVIL